MEYTVLGKTGLKVSRMGLGGIPVQRIDREGTRKLLQATNGHTLVLFTSYTMMGSVYRELKGKVSVPILRVWKDSQRVIREFKEQKNAALFAAGSCWEGMDFPGDMVSSLIMVRLPFYHKPHSSVTCN